MEGNRDGVRVPRALGGDGLGRFWFGVVGVEVRDGPGHEAVGRDQLVADRIAHTAQSGDLVGECADMVVELGVVLVSCRLSPAGLGFLDVLFPPEVSALLTVGLPARYQGGPDSVEVSVFRAHETRPGWVPSLPRGGGRWRTSSPLSRPSWSTGIVGGPGMRPRTPCLLISTIDTIPSGSRRSWVGSHLMSTRPAIINRFPREPGNPLSDEAGEPQIRRTRLCPCDRSCQEGHTSPP